MQTVVETPVFSRQADKLFGADEKAALIEFLAANPFVGDETPGTGGVRKVRVPASGRGKRGGARVIYYVYDEAHPLYALLVYAKGAKADMSSDQKKTVATLAAQLKATMRATK